MPLNITLRVKNLIKKYGTRDPFKIAKYENINILFEPLGNIKGYYRKIFGRKFIVVNSELDEFSQLIIVSHELGHALLHTTKGIKFMREHTLLYNSNLIEQQADKFAAELIIYENMDYEQFLIDNCILDEKIHKKLFDLKYNYKS